MKTKDLRSKKVVLGTYVPSDIINRSPYYSGRNRAKDAMEKLVERLDKCSQDIFVYDSQVEKLCIGNNTNVHVAMIDVWFTYDKRRDAKKSFSKILDSGLMLRSDPLHYLSPMIQRGEFSEGLEYKIEERGRNALTWLVGSLKTVNIFGIRGLSGSEYKLNGLVEKY